MAGMFNAPCCGTCKHGFLLNGDKPEDRASQRWNCKFHRKRLPDWLPVWKQELVICQAWHHYNDTSSGVEHEWLRRAYPDAGLLYNYRDEYTPRKREVMRLADLPECDEATPLE